MPNPGAFQGSRKVFLLSKKDKFAKSVALGYTGELLATIQREYFKRYPIDLPHHQEPTPEHLASVDDDAADPEVEEPDESKMGAEDYQSAMEKLNERRVLIAKRKAQIRRWLIYQYMKHSDGDPRDQRAFSPYHIFLSNLRGTVSDKPRRKSAVNVWRKFHRERIERVSKLTAEREKVPRSGMASLRDRIARKMFDDLPKEERSEWNETSIQEHELACQEWEKKRKCSISTDPEDRQRAIQGLVRFIQPALNVIADATGWKVTLFAGGPEPAQEGKLNVISVHSGTTTGDIKLTFGQSERAAIKKDLIPAFGAFLQKCYTPEECRARALSGLEGFVPLSDMELEGSQAIIHTLSTNTVADIEPTAASPSAIAASGGAGASTTTARPSAAPPSAATAVAPPSAIAASGGAGTLTTTTRPSATRPSAATAVAPPAAIAASGGTRALTTTTRPSATRPSAATAVAPPAAIAASGGTRTSTTTTQPSASPPSALVEPTAAAAPANTQATTPAPVAPAVPDSREAVGDVVEDEGAEEEDTPLPVVYRLSSEPPATPVHVPLSPIPSRQASIAPSCPPSPAAGPLPDAPLLAGLANIVRGNVPKNSHDVSIAPSSTNAVSAAPAYSASSRPPASSPPFVPPAAPPVALDSPAPALQKAKPAKAKGSKGSAKEKINPVPAEASVVKENHRPRRELKKTAKALSIEEEMLKKNGRGIKRSRAVVEDQAPPEPTSKRMRGASKKGSRV